MGVCPNLDVSEPVVFCRTGSSICLLELFYLYLYTVQWNSVSIFLLRTFLKWDSLGVLLLNLATYTGCSREFTHRVKSVSMSKFTSQEVENLENGGNEVCDNLAHLEVGLYKSLMWHGDWVSAWLWIEYLFYMSLCNMCIGEMQIKRDSASP
jgi:hypothetical protein